jgi:hypothetical protein
MTCPRQNIHKTAATSAPEIKRDQRQIIKRKRANSGLLLSVIMVLCAAPPGHERDVRELIEATSMACVDLPPREARALRTLLRVASGKLGEAEAGIEAQNEATAVVGLPGRPLGLDI